MNVLNSEIRADKDGLFDFDQRLSFLYKERIFLENRLKSNNEFAVKFDAQIGPFEKMYDKLTDGMTSLMIMLKLNIKKVLQYLFVNLIIIHYGNNRVIVLMQHHLNQNKCNI